MSVTYVIGFQVKPDERERFLHLLNGVLDAMREAEGFLSATLNANPDDPHHFLLHESWADHQHVLDVELHKPYRAEWHAALPDLMEGDRDISLWQMVRSD
jgi:quinol monooxygenase YgiN